MGEEPWEEALDLDDSDFSTLRRPLKRPNHLITTTTSTTTANNNNKGLCLSQPFLNRCSSLHSQTSQNPPFFSPQFHLPPPPLLPSPPPPPPPPPPTSSSSGRLIPGPAGTVQSAMNRRKNQNFSDENPIPTQEYIRKAVEDGGAETDDDFSRDPWRSAIDYIRREGLAINADNSHGAIGIPLSEIKKNQIRFYNNNNNNINNKVGQVVAIVKSCKSNGFGDMMVTLKDPTGTIEASIHRRAIAETEFGKDISVGAVMVLKNVAVFSVSRVSHYLNVTLSNLVMVMSKDGRVPSQKQQQNCSQELRAAEGILSGMRRNSGVNEKGNGGKLVDVCSKEGSGSGEGIEKREVKNSTDLRLRWTDEQLDELFAFD